jgi:hypothetical protein
MHVGGIVCDLGKAFDCVNHEMLLTELHYFGIKGSVANWLNSYLAENKRQT